MAGGSLKVLKGAQVAVAVVSTAGAGAGLMLPGIMGLFVAPVGLLYVGWSIRAALDRRLSIRLVVALHGVHWRWATGRATE